MLVATCWRVINPNKKLRYGFMLISTNELTAAAGPVINSFKIIEEPDYNQKLQGIFIESSSKILSSLRATVAGRVFN